MKQFYSRFYQGLAEGVRKFLAEGVPEFKKPCLQNKAKTINKYKLRFSGISQNFENSQHLDKHSFRQGQNGQKS